MTNLQYNIISGKNHAIRRTNRQQFLREAIGAKGNQQVSVLMLCYNDVDQFFRALDRIDREPKRHEFMVTIVQNSDREESLRLFDERIKNYDNITILYPVQNLGSAGGYALGQEYILSQGYSHLIMLEDDVTLLEDDTISETIDAISNNKDVVFINPPVNAGGNHSWYVQFACYPVTLLQQTGTIDPRYFFRAEDLEWGKRVEDAIRIYGYAKKTVERNYYHPYLKGVNNSGSWIYFSVRNQLWTFRKHTEGFVRLTLALAQYIAFGVLIFFRTGKSLILMCIRYAVKDGMGNYKSLDHHGNMIDMFSTYQKVSIEDMGFSSHNKDMSYIKEKGVNTGHIIARTSISLPDRKHLAKYLGHLTISGGFQPVWGTMIACMKKIFVIESLRGDEHMLTGKLLKQKKRSQGLNLLLFLPCVLVGSLTALVTGIWLLCVTYLRR